MKFSYFGNFTRKQGFLFQRRMTVSHFEHNGIFAIMPRIETAPGAPARFLKACK